MWSETQAWEMWPNGWPDCRMLSVPVSHTINNWCPQLTGAESQHLVAGFVVLCGANIVGNIISAEKRCNYPGRSRVTRLVNVYVSLLYFFIIL